MGMEGMDTVITNDIRRMWPLACVAGVLIALCITAIVVLSK